MIEPCGIEYDFGNSRSHMPGTCHAAQSPFEQKPEKRKGTNLSFNKCIYTTKLQNSNITCSCKPIISLFSACRYFNLKGNKKLEST
jgi:hypothetical protein